MNPIILLEPLSYLRHAPADGFIDTPEALTYQGAKACVRFDKGSGCITLDPPGADVLQLQRELSKLTMMQNDQEKALILEKLRKRPF